MYYVELQLQFTSKMGKAAESANKNSASSKGGGKSVFVDTNRWKNGCFCTNFCKACTCLRVDLLTTPVGSLKIIELVRNLTMYILKIKQ